MSGHTVFCTPQHAHSIRIATRDDQVRVTVTRHGNNNNNANFHVDIQHRMSRSACDHQTRRLAAHRARHSPDTPPTQYRYRTVRSRPGVARGTTWPLHAQAVGAAGRPLSPFGNAAVRAANGPRRAAARPQTAAVASAVTPTIRLVDPRPPVDRTASVVAPESVAVAGLSCSEGGNRAERARVRGLGARGGHTPRRRAKEAPATAH